MPDAEVFDGAVCTRTPMTAEEHHHLSAVCGVPVRGPVVARRRNDGPDPRVAHIASTMAEMRLAKIRKYGIGKHWDPKAVEELIDELRPAVVRRYRGAVEAIWAGSDIQAAKDAAFVEPTKQKERITANLAAMKIAAAMPPGTIPTPRQRDVLRGYSGFGGISDFYKRPETGTDGNLPEFEVAPKYAKEVPEGFPRHEMEGLINEYYTPTFVAEEIKRVTEPLVSRQSTNVRALEPSAGIGRLVEPWVGGQAIDWTLVEFSGVSSLFLSRLYPSSEVLHQSFEEAVSNSPEWAGAFDLVVANPPYGPRYSSELDPDFTKVSTAQAYFTERLPGLVAPDGVLVLFIPAGWLTGRTPSARHQRESVLRRMHLLGAYRVPNTTFVGANLSLDIVFLQGRGGMLAGDLPEADQAILEGRYYQEYPQNILGEEIGAEAPGWPIPGQGRYGGYTVKGSFEGFPKNPVWRPMCQTCGLIEVEHVPSRPGVRRQRKADVVGAIREISADQLTHAGARGANIGERILRYLSRLSPDAVDPVEQSRAHDMWPELHADITAWRSVFGLPEDSAELVALADEGLRGARAFIDAYSGGELDPVLATQPTTSDSFSGSANDLAGQAAKMYGRREFVEPGVLQQFHNSLGGTLTAREAMLQLFNADWCLTPDGWVPGHNYYSGDLWAKYDDAVAGRAANVSTDVREQLQEQATKLMGLIGPATWEEIGEFSPRSSWVPLDIINEWFFTAYYDPDSATSEGSKLRNSKPRDLTKRQRVAGTKKRWLGSWLRFHPEEGGGGLWIQTRPPKFDDYNSDGQFGEWVSWDYKIGTGGPFNRAVAEMLGYLRNEKLLFRPHRETGDETPIGVLQDRLARKYRRAFRAWVEAHPEHQERLLEIYNRQSRGWKVPEYSSSPPWIDRWTGHIVPFPHQAAGTNRALAQHGALLAFDTGVGKTFSAIGIVGAGRQTQKGPRPAIVMPRSLLANWVSEIRKCMPDYDIAIIGMNLKTDANGRMTGTNDTAPQRVAKWRAFAAGVYDVILISDSQLPAAGESEELLKLYQTTNVALAMQLAEERAKELREAKSKKKKIEEEADKTATDPSAALAAMAAEAEADQEKSMAGLTPRQAALVKVGVNRRIVERLMAKTDPDPGITWDAVGINPLIVDEAQNYKNLYGVPSRNMAAGAKFMGDPGKGAKRSWQMDIRCYDVRGRGGAIYLLSATPAKNSPLEYYNVLQYIDPEWFLRRDIRGPSDFVDRFLDITTAVTIDVGNAPIRKPVVQGFINLDELRTILFRYGEFQNAETVNLAVPESPKELIDVPITDVQKIEIAQWKNYIREQKDLDPELRDPGAILVALNKMSAAAIHPSLGMFQPTAVAKTLDAEDKKDAAIIAKEKKRNAKQFAATQALIKSGELDPVAPKFTYAADNIKANSSCGHIVFIDSIRAHAMMREVLIRTGIDPARIAVLNGEVAKSPAKRQMIADDFNGDLKAKPARLPKYDVLIANAIAYEGVNLQKRTCAVHHIDIPWEPATLQQRNGRAVRQGNTIGSVDLKYYLVPLSADGYRLEMVHGKSEWMKLILDSKAAKAANPAASGDVRKQGNAVLMMITDDPAEAARMYAEMQDDYASKMIAEQRKNAILTFRRWAAASRTLRSPVLEATRAPAFQAQATEALAELEKFDLRVFPFRYAVDAVKTVSSPVWATDRGAPLLPGMVLPAGVLHDKRVVIGDVRGANDQTLVARVVGTGDWYLALGSDLSEEQAAVLIEDWWVDEALDPPEVVEPPPAQLLASAINEALASDRSVEKVFRTLVYAPEKFVRTALVDENNRRRYLQNYYWGPQRRRHAYDDAVRLPLPVRYLGKVWLLANGVLCPLDQKQHWDRLDDENVSVRYAPGTPPRMTPNAVVSGQVEIGPLLPESRWSNRPDFEQAPKFFPMLMPYEEDWAAWLDALRGNKIPQWLLGLIAPRYFGRDMPPHVREHGAAVLGVSDVPVP